MISKVLLSGPNFNGQVKIGKDKKEKTRIAKDIKNVPENYRNYFIDSINATKAVLAARTPDDTKLTLHLRKYSKEEGGYKGIVANATDDNNLDKTIGVSAKMDYIFDGEENEHFGTDVEDRLSELRETVLNKISTIKEQGKREEVPKTTKEILNRLA